MKEGFTFNKASLHFLRKYTFKNFGGGEKTEKSLSQAAACDGNNYTTSAGEQNPTPSTLPIY